MYFDSNYIVICSHSSSIQWATIDSDNGLSPYMSPGMGILMLFAQSSVLAFWLKYTMYRILEFEVP